MDVEDIPRPHATPTRRADDVASRLLFESNPNPMCIFDEATLRFLAVNDAAVKLYGWSRATFRRMSLGDLHPPGEGPALARRLARQRRSPEFLGTWQHRKKDRTAFEVELTVSHIRFRGVDARLALLHDITDRERAASALRQSEERLRADLDAMTRLHELGMLSVREENLQPVLAKIVDVAIAISHADFGCLQLRDSASASLKIVAQRGLPKSWVRFWDGATGRQGSPGTALTQGRRIIVEDVTQSPIFAGADALEVQLRAGVRAMQSTPLVSRSGRPLGVFSTHYRTPHRPNERVLRLLDLLARQAADLIERVQTDAALRASRHTLETALNHLPAAVCLIRGNDLRLQWVNPAYQAIAPGKAMLGRTLDELWPETGQEFTALCRRVLRTGKPHQVVDELNTIRRRPDGPLEAAYFSWSLNRVRLPGDEGWGLLNAAWETTARKQAEERVRDSERLYRAIGESINYGVWVCAPDGRNTYASESFLRLVGLTQEQCSNFGWGDVLHPEDAAETISAWRECVRTEGRWDREHRFRGVNGQWHHILARGVPVRNEQGRILCWAGINLDITRLKRAEEQLKELNATLEQRVAERTQEWRVANELLVQEMQRRRELEGQVLDIREGEQHRIGQELHDDVCSQLSGIEYLCLALARDLEGSAARRQVKLITRLLREATEDARRLAHGLSPLRLDAHGLLIGLSDLVARTRKIYGRHCSFRGNPTALTADPAKALHVYRIAQEALTNAARHSEARRITVTLAVRDRTLILRVRDDGKGYTPNPHPQPGMGLRTMELRASAVGGSLVVQRNPQGGTDVVCTIPNSLPTSKPNKDA